MEGGELVQANLVVLTSLASHIGDLVPGGGNQD